MNDLTTFRSNSLQISKFPTFCLNSVGVQVLWRELPVTGWQNVFIQNGGYTVMVLDGLNWVIVAHFESNMPFLPSHQLASKWIIILNKSSNYDNDNDNNSNFFLLVWMIWFIKLFYKQFIQKKFLLCKNYDT